MRLVILFSLIASSFVFGCASQNRVSAPNMDDPSWVPPGELHFAMSESATKEATPHKQSSPQAAAKPNHSEIVHGKLHAAR